MTILKGNWQNEGHENNEQKKFRPQALQTIPQIKSYEF